MGAGEVAGIVWAAVTGVAGHEREHAQRPGQSDDVRCRVHDRAEDGCWRLAVLDPVDDGGQRVRGRGSRGAGAVLGAGCEEQPGEGSVSVVDPATNTVTLSRPLCMFPLVARYTGHGNPNDASNFICAHRA